MRLLRPHILIERSINSLVYQSKDLFECIVNALLSPKMSFCSSVMERLMKRVIDGHHTGDGFY